MLLIEVLYWIISIGMLIIVLVLGPDLIGRMLLVSFVIQIIALMFWRVIIAYKSKFTSLVHECVGTGNRMSTARRDIRIVMDGIESGDLKVSDETLKMLRSLKRSICFGFFPIWLFIVLFILKFVLENR